MSDRYLQRKTIHAMHRLYGEDVTGQICEDCPHLVSMKNGTKICVLYGKAEWKPEWQACMLINHDPDESWVPVEQRL